MHQISLYICCVNSTERLANKNNKYYVIARAFLYQDKDVKKLHTLSERLVPLGIVGAQLRDPLEPLNTKCCDSARAFRVALN